MIAITRVVHVRLFFMNRNILKQVHGDELHRGLLGEDLMVLWFFSLLLFQSEYRIVEKRVKCVVKELPNWHLLLLLLVLYESQDVLKHVVRVTLFLPLFELPMLLMLCQLLVCVEVSPSLPCLWVNFQTVLISKIIPKLFNNTLTVCRKTTYKPNLTKII